MKEALSSFETSVLTIAKRCHIPEDGILHAKSQFIVTDRFILDSASTEIFTSVRNEEYAMLSIHQVHISSLLRFFQPFPPYFLSFLFTFLYCEFIYHGLFSIYQILPVAMCPWFPVGLY
jgi:hypothetical protein